MKRLLNRTIAVLLIAVIVIGMAGCGNSSDKKENTSNKSPNESSNESPNESTEVSKDNLVVAISGEPTTLDPYAHSLYYGFIPATLLFDTLITKDASGGYIPELATDWEFVDDLTLSLKLRDDVKFHDGTPFTAEDVKFTLAKASESSFSSALFACIDNENTTVINDHTLELKLKYPYAPLLEVLSSFRASIISKASYEADSDAYGHNPNGTGPMKMDNWYSGDRIDLTANTDYWGENLAFKTTTFRVVVEASSRTIELETGGIDIAVDVPFSDWSRVEDDPKLTLVKDRTNLMASLVFNNSMDLFKDVRVRKALAHGLDINALVKTVWEGTAEVADSYYASTLLGYKSLEPIEYNVDKAKQLLADAGYPDGFEFTYTTYQTVLNQSFAEVIENMWSKIGVKMNIDIVDLATFTSMNNGGELTAALMTPNVPISDPAAALILWPISRTISLRHNDQHIQDLLDAGSSTYNEAERTKLYQELQDYLYENTYTVPMAYPTFAFGISSSVDGFNFNPSQVPDLTKISFNK